MAEIRVLTSLKYHKNMNTGEIMEFVHITLKGNFMIFNLRIKSKFHYQPCDDDAITRYSVMACCDDNDVELSTTVIRSDFPLSTTT